MIQRNSLTPSAIKNYLDSQVLQLSPTGDLLPSYQLFENKPILFSAEEISKDVKLEIYLLLKVKEQLYFSLQLNIDKKIVYETPFLSFDHPKLSEEIIEIFYQDYLSRLESTKH